MIRFLHLLLFAQVLYLLTLFPATAQIVQWGTQVVGSGGIAFDSKGNIWNTGSFQGSVTFGESKLQTTSAAESAGAYTGGIVTMTAPSGKPIRAFGATGASFGGVVIDKHDNLYVCGAAQGQFVTFTDGTMLECGFTPKALVVSFTSDGKVRWAKLWGTDVYGYQLLLDRRGTLIMSGGMSHYGGGKFGEFDIGRGGPTYWSSFVARIDLDGNVLNAVRIGNDRSDVALTGVALGPNNSIVFSGLFRGTVRFGKAGIYTSHGLNDGVIISCDTSLQPQWVRPFSMGDYENIGAVAVDPDGMIYFAGDLQGEADIGVGTVKSRGATDIIIAKLDRKGNPLWVKTAGSTENDHGRGIAVDSRGRVIVTGFCGIGSVEVDTVTLKSPMWMNMLVAVFDANAGKFLGAELLSPASGGYVISRNGDAYLTGMFSGKLQAGTSTLDNNQIGNGGGMLLKLSLPSVNQ